MPELNNNTHIDQRDISYEVRTLIEYQPRWIIRRGNLLLAGLVIAMLSLSFVIRYPDLVNGQLKLVAVNAPKELVSRVNGKLVKILVGNEKGVTKGQPVAFIESTGSHEQVLALHYWIDSIESDGSFKDLSALLSRPLPVLHQLGEAQSAFETFRLVWNESRQVPVNGYYSKKHQTLKHDLALLDVAEENIKKQSALLKNDLELQQAEMTAQQSLANDKVIATRELNEAKSKLIGKEKMLEQVNAQLISHQLDRENKKKELLELNKYMTDQEQKMYAALFTLKSRIQEWLQQYVIIAAESGQLVYASFLQENQMLTNGQTICYILPPAEKYYGQLLVPQERFGKIRTGQKVRIMVESYPVSEYGYVTGVVTHIPGVPLPNDSFLLKVDLPNGLATNYNKTIFFRNNLTAKAQVITNDRTLISRLGGKLRDAAIQQ